MKYFLIGTAALVGVVLAADYVMKKIGSNWSK